MKKTIIVSLITLIIAGGGGFYAGMKYQQKKTPQELLRANFQKGAASGGNFSGRNGGSNNGGQNQNRNIGFANGEILSKDDKSITVKMSAPQRQGQAAASADQNTGSKIIFFSDSTTITKSQTGTKDDLVAGAQVMITGQANSDGSITAQNVQIR